MRAWVLAAAVLPAAALVQRTDVSHDSRRLFSIEEFGFLEDGELNLSLELFAFDKPEWAETNFAGFGLFRSLSEVGIQAELHQDIKELRESSAFCPLLHPEVLIFDDLMFGKGYPQKELGVTDDPRKTFRKIESQVEGIYDLIFVNCGPALESTVSFTLKSEMRNKGGFLSAGLLPLPSLLFFFFFVYAGMFATWVLVLRNHKENTHKLHHLMTAFLVLKTASIFSYAMDMHFVKAYGHSIGWSFLYHLFRGLRAIMFFLVIILIGTGWSILKPALSDKERKLLLFVLPLQLVANIVLYISDEMLEGSSSFRYWRFLFVWLDLTCCLIIAMPIWQHIRHLEAQASIGSKQQVNLAKLKKFRNIFLAVVAFIYTTRFLLFLMGNMLNFKLRYLEIVTREVVTIVFYIYIGRMLFPTAQSAYLKVSTRENYEGMAAVNGGGARNGASTSFDTEDDPFDQDMFFEDEHTSEFGLGNDVEMARIPQRS